MKSKKSWLASMRAIIAKLPHTFTTQDVYAYEKQLQRAHPENNNIRPKIRQQLQLLRDKGALTNPSLATWEKAL